MDEYKTIAQIGLTIRIEICKPKLNQTDKTQIQSKLNESQIGYR